MHHTLTTLVVVKEGITQRILLVFLRMATAILIALVCHLLLWLSSPESGITLPSPSQRLSAGQTPAKLTQSFVSMSTANRQGAPQIRVTSSVRVPSQAILLLAVMTTQAVVLAAAPALVHAIRGTWIIFEFGRLRSMPSLLPFTCNAMPSLNTHTLMCWWLTSTFGPTLLTIQSWTTRLVSSMQQ